MAAQDDHRQSLFDQWAPNYDAAVESEDGFPFAGYADVLTATVGFAAPQPADAVLDLGTGTGTLAGRFLDAGCIVTGVDHAPEMLRIAADRLPGVEVLPLDLLGSWDAIAGRRFAIVASAYVLHEFDLETKLALIDRLAADHLLPGGRLVMADIGFATVADRDAAHATWRDAWDEDEHYWAADETLPRLQERGFIADWHQVSPVAGVCQIAPVIDRTNPSIP